MKKISSLISLILLPATLILTPGCKKKIEEPVITVPGVITKAVNNIQATTAKSGGYISNDGGSAVTARGVCWSSTTQVPVITDNKTMDGNGKGDFISSLTPLVANTPYYIRAYATNSMGTAYGNVLLFSTPIINASLYTASPTSITTGSAISGGNITDNGGSSISARGVCWSSTNPSPTIADTKTSDGTGSGNFVSLLTGLTANTSYFLRAYCINSIGPSYGNVLKFTTIPLPVVVTVGCSNIMISNADFEGNVTDDGGDTVTSRGFCWSSHTQSPTIDDDMMICGTGTGTFTAHVERLTGQTTYHLRAYAINKNGTGYGNILTFSTLDTVCTDIDNNRYRVGQIGSQIWMLENLRVKHYRNGDVIPNVWINTQWPNVTGGAMCWYMNDSVRYADYGPFYNWLAVIDNRILPPAGWHIPSDAEWTILTDYLGGKKVAGGKMKEAGTDHWFSPNTGADNSSGFSAFASGGRGANGSYSAIGVNTDYWTATKELYSMSLSYLTTSAYLIDHQPKIALSIRCLKD